MVSLKDAHISTKLTLLSVATSAVALICVVMAFFVQDYRLVKRVKFEQVQAQVSMLADNLRHALNEDERAEIPGIINSALTEHGIVAASVITAPGADVIVPVDEVEIQRQFSGWFFSVRRLEVPLQYQGERTGKLILYVGYSDVEARLLYLLGYSALAFVLAIFIAYVVAHKVQKWVSRPLLRLFNLSQQVVHSGNYAVRSDIVSRDEIGRLSAAFNQMLGHIESRDLMLEKQVHQRTRELRKLAEDFRYRALHDSLTGLPNRALLLEEFNRAVAHANRVGKFFSVMLLDLDNFKTINDTMGHDAGDQLLQKVSTIVRQALRGEDIVCRLGGDEFVVLLEDVESEKSLNFVGRSLLAALNREVWVQDQPVRLGASIGASIYPQHGATLEELKHNADVALYRAKEAGRNRLVVFDAELATRAKHKLLLQNELKLAITNKELELHFQPQIDTRLKIVIGCEVFVRWHHQGLGFMQPADFLGHAEEAGIIQQIDHFVLKEACRQCCEWRRDHDVHLPVSINISSSMFQSDDLVRVISQTLREFDLPANFLTLELHEDMYSNYAGSGETVRELRDMGVKFSLGDFGAGHFSMHHWRDASIEVAYLHRGVVKNLTSDAASQVFIKALLRFAEELKVSIVAQGVEDHQQAELLESLDCHQMQGFLFAPPMENETFLAWLDTLSDLHLPKHAHLEAKARGAKPSPSGSPSPPGGASRSGTNSQETTGEKPDD